ncbi:hypothetical protein POM88_015410 [Heracleum sosnowskyi]|uniref:Uncharacterized protein n=1 Tax=Heracleum sosnowskyi TaxID=360622 RepID=A0AAD8IK53_9APIA|nr:hypothetical protein POM88_015410 [Heracleum sosnowskyi]
MCWIFPKSVLAQQLGSGFHGLDIGDVGLDWSSISAYLERLLASPWFATANVALACAIAFFFTFPIGIITAITNKAPGLNIITEYIIGYIYPGYQVANMYVKVYGYINMSQEITFLQDFKLGKLPPRTMFLAQIVYRPLNNYPGRSSEVFMQQDRVE